MWGALCCVQQKRDRIEEDPHRGSLTCLRNRNRWISSIVLGILALGPSDTEWHTLKHTWGLVLITGTALAEDQASEMPVCGGMWAMFAGVCTPNARTRAWCSLEGRIFKSDKLYILSRHLWNRCVTALCYVLFCLLNGFPSIAQAGRVGLLGSTPCLACTCQTSPNWKDVFLA